ncbi:hypothetical protein [Gordonia terrae]|uniref:hypothetical protein n=1 Tax=Gordonia terrae TaxID=2055 RepID=UPI003F6AC0A0
MGNRRPRGGNRDKYADDPYIAHADVVETIAAQADPADTVAALINAAYARHPWISPVLHVGTAMALRLALALNSSGIRRHPR